ncbi:hypothetical protein [Paramagnetospirillum magneticum]|uniref:Uncharacterized protein n=1 Tax=Paramagnetospirillum magneticum (strain ATCC 700264 / AMB-1) TaxID=342108 RepID=Q2W2F9_PARM1|nr:hypothetical protein [Paramagnetospirillum magneticum]BAE51966.1 hypothetical protein amb3162 [Paramagnetospirillum magneticum AMB-1]
MASRDDVWTWRMRASGAVAAVAHRLKETYASAYYVQERHGSPWKSVKLASEVADKIISVSQGETWEEFRLAACHALQTEREIFFTDDLADPDGYVCGTLREFIAALTPSGPTMTQGDLHGPSIAWVIAILMLICSPLLALGAAIFFSG